MKFGPITVKDKLGRDVVLRNAELSDAENLIKYLKVTSDETPFLMKDGDEITMTMEMEEAFLRSKIEDERELVLVATVDGRHIGNCGLMSFGDYRRYQHRCTVAIALYQEFCGFGIGKLMLETVLDKAKSVGYEQAELEVIAGNDGAKTLYEKLGFEEYGRFPDSTKYSDGTYADSYWMMKKL